MWKNVQLFQSPTNFRAGTPIKIFTSLSYFSEEISEIQFFAQIQKNAGLESACLFMYVSLPNLCNIDSIHFSSPSLRCPRITLRKEIVKQGNRVIGILQEMLAERAAVDGDPLAFLSLPESREAVNKGVRELDKGHDDDLGGWPGMRGMKFPQM